MFQLVLSKLYLKHHCLISFCMDIHSMPIAISYFILFFFWFIGIYYWATIVFWFFDFVVQVRYLAQCGVLTVAETTRNITKRLMPSSARHCCVTGVERGTELPSTVCTSRQSLVCIVPKLHVYCFLSQCQHNFKISFTVNCESGRLQLATSLWILFYLIWLAFAWNNS